MAAGNGQWGDLPARLGSAVVMLGLGGGAIWAGGMAFLGMIILVIAAMQWELARLTAKDPSQPEALMVAGLAVLALLYIFAFGGIAGWVAMFAPSVALLARPRPRAWVAFGYAFLIMLAGLTFVFLRELGAVALLWLVLVVVVSDVAGYFAGRSLGGPKFWPAVSPKKTWSGTVAGWIGAALVGVVLWAAGEAGPGVILLSPLVAFAGQLGDILESWMKRRAGVKDSSNLIPGHGGFLDRFDALILAAVVVFPAMVFAPLLLPGTS